MNNQKVNRSVAWQDYFSYIYNKKIILSTFSQFTILEGYQDLFINATEQKCKTQKETILQLTKAKYSKNQCLNW